MSDEFLEGFYFGCLFLSLMTFCSVLCLYVIRTKVHELTMLVESDE